MAKRVQFELGDHYVNGEYGDDDDHLFNGILTQMAKDTEVIVVDSAESTMLGRLKAMRAKIPVAIRNNPDLRILMSVNDFDKYDDEPDPARVQEHERNRCECPSLQGHYH